MLPSQPEFSFHTKSLSWTPMGVSHSDCFLIQAQHEKRLFRQHSRMRKAFLSQKPLHPIGSVICAIPWIHHWHQKGWKDLQLRDPAHSHVRYKNCQKLNSSRGNQGSVEQRIRNHCWREKTQMSNRLYIHNDLKY